MFPVYLMIMYKVMYIVPAPERLLVVSPMGLEIRNHQLRIDTCLINSTYTVQQSTNTNVFMNRGGQKKLLGDQQPMKRAQRPALDAAGAAGAAGAARDAGRDAARGGSDWTAAHGCSTPGGQQRWQSVLLS